MLTGDGAAPVGSEPTIAVDYFRRSEPLNRQLCPRQLQPFFDRCFAAYLLLARRFGLYSLVWAVQPVLNTARRWTIAILLLLGPRWLAEHALVSTMVQTKISVIFCLPSSPPHGIRHELPWISGTLFDHAPSFPCDSVPVLLSLGSGWRNIAFVGVSSFLMSFFQGGEAFAALATDACGINDFHSLARLASQIR